ncbi:Zinc finger GRF-type protein [Arachis hypogaea]|nr:Zinc finger GRF-type protein [Arachis hypogaea]
MTASFVQASGAKSSIIVLLLWDDAVTAKKLLLTASQRNLAHLYLFCSEKPPVSTTIECTPVVIRRVGHDGAKSSHHYSHSHRSRPVLRWSGTDSNPERPFLGCPNYNTMGKKWCGLFLWVDKVLEKDVIACDDRTRHLVDNEEWKMKIT